MCILIRRKVKPQPSWNQAVSGLTIKIGSSGSVILHPNEQLTYNHADASFLKSYVDASRLSTWTKGYLIFQQETLANIFRALERQYKVKINYNDTKYASMTFTVRFHARESLEEALDVLKKNWS